MPIRNTRINLLLSLFTLSVLTGCVEEKVPRNIGIPRSPTADSTDFIDARPTKGRPMPTVGQTADAQSAHTKIENLAPLQACADRLHDIEGALLLYFQLHAAFPEKLEDLQSLPDIGSSLVFSCPDSHQHYVYVQAGKQSAGRTKRLLLHDADGTHDGNRWGVLMTPGYGGFPPSLEVVVLPPDLFRTYLLVSEQRN